MLYIAIAASLFSLMGGVLLLSKVKTDAMGSFAKWMAYLVIVISLGMVACALGRVVTNMFHCRGSEMSHHRMGGMMYCPPEMCGGQACYMSADGKCVMPAGGKMEKGECCDEKMEGGKGECDDMEGHEHNSMHKDTASVK